jgi:hypothetical protein
VDEHDIITRIRAFVADEQALRLRHEGAEMPPEDAEKLRRVEEELDQCYDLLRQRRAQREFGGDPNAASPRDPETVENYLQ